MSASNLSSFNPLFIGALLRTFETRCLMAKVTVSGRTFQSPLHRGTSVIRSSIFQGRQRGSGKGFNPLFIGAEHIGHRHVTWAGSRELGGVRRRFFQSPLHRGTSVICPACPKAMGRTNGPLTFQSPRHRGHIGHPLAASWQQTVAGSNTPFSIPSSSGHIGHLRPTGLFG